MHAADDAGEVAVRGPSTVDPFAAARARFEEMLGHVGGAKAPEHHASRGWEDVGSRGALDALTASVERRRDEQGWRWARGHEGRMLAGVERSAIAVVRPTPGRPADRDPADVGECERKGARRVGTHQAVQPRPKSTELGGPPASKVQRSGR